MSDGGWGFQHATAITFGRGCVGDVGIAVAAFGRRALLVTGGASFDAAPWSPGILEALAAAGVSVRRAVAVGEPDTRVVDAAAAEAVAGRCDVVLAVGGGSAMDLAKAAAVVATNGGSSLEYLEALPRGAARSIDHDPLPVVCVPTTAGTGSEVTRNAVLQAGDFRVKRSMRSDRMFPKRALVDPDLIATCPPKVAAACGFDALTHLVESWCSTNASPVTDALARDAIPAVLEALAGLSTFPDLLADGAPGTAMRLRAHAPELADLVTEHLARCALIAGICLVNAGLGAAHGLVAPLGGLFPSAPHGAALAALLPATLRMNAAVAVRRGSDRAKLRLLEVAALLGASPPIEDEATAILAHSFPDRIRHPGVESDIGMACENLDGLRRRLGLPGLGAYGIGEADFAAIADAPSGSLRTNPVSLTRDELIGILRDAARD